MLLDAPARHNFEVELDFLATYILEVAADPI